MNEKKEDKSICFFFFFPQPQKAGSLSMCLSISRCQFHTLKTMLKETLSINYIQKEPSTTEEKIPQKDTAMQRQARGTDGIGAWHQ